MDNTDIIRRIVQFYKQKRILWDAKHPHYYDKLKRDVVWKELSEEMNIPIIDLKKKILSLTGSYRREKSRIRARQLSGGDGEVYTSKWFAFEWFKFLDKETLIDQKDSSIRDEIISTKDLTEPASILKKRSKRVVVKRRHASTESQSVFPTKQLSNAPSKRVEEDEFDAFARNVALQLKQLPLIYALESQEYIQRILKEQRIKAMEEQAHQNSGAIPSDETFDLRNHSISVYEIKKVESDPLDQ